jgi:hypothetical protein
MGMTMGMIMGMITGMITGMIMVDTITATLMEASLSRIMEAATITAMTMGASTIMAMTTEAPRKHLAQYLPLF